MGGWVGGWVDLSRKVVLRTADCSQNFKFKLCLAEGSLKNSRIPRIPGWQTCLVPLSDLAMKKMASFKHADNDKAPKSFYTPLQKC